MKLKAIIENIFSISIIKTVFLNYKCFGLKTACKFPIIVQRRTKIKSLNKIEIVGPISSGLIVIGENCLINIEGKLIFNGKARIGPGCRFFVDSNAVLSIGSHFTATSTLKINCRQKVTFGKNCLLSWGIQILDTDFHKIYVNGNLMNEDQQINIGNHVWIGFDTKILKGTEVSDNIIIGSCSLLNKKYNEEHSIYAGTPAKWIKSGVTWDY